MKCKLGHEKDGNGRRGGRCQECERARQRVYQSSYQMAVRAVLDAEKISRGCAACGYRAHVAALHWDHIIPQYKFSPKPKQKRTGPKYMKQARDLVADPNVQVLCANCHAIKTRVNGDYKRTP